MTHVDGPDCRVVIYDSPQHTWGYVQQLLSSAGLPPEQVEDVVHRIHFGGRAEVPMPDLDRAQALFDRLIGAGPDREHPASDVVLYALRLQRVGGALVHEHAIEVRKGLSRALVRWERLRGFRDTSDYVQLLRKGDRVPEPALTITTRDDRERARLLDVLIERGLRREEP